MNPFFTDTASYFDRLFPGLKVQKISIGLSQSCPNRDGTISRGGCIYCSNASFAPAYCLGGAGVRAQLEEGKHFFSHKYSRMKYLAYFQTFTATYGLAAGELEKACREACETADVVGIVIGTRPDCIPDSIVEMLAKLPCTVIVELGAESSHDSTLYKINRGHTWATTVDAVRRLHQAGLHCGLHLIAGLPGETDADVISTIKAVCQLPVDSIKLHQLQILRGTELSRLWHAGEIAVSPYSPEQYLDLCEQIIEIVPPSIAIERFVAQAPGTLLEAPRWGLKNHEFTDRLLSRLRAKNKISASCNKYATP